MIAHGNKFNDRESLIDYLEQSASEVAASVGFRSEAEMEALAERNGVYYIPRRLDDEEDDLDDDELWEDEDASCNPYVPPIADDRKNDDAKTNSSPVPDQEANRKPKPKAKKQDSPPDPIADLQRLVARVKYGDDQAVEEIRRRLDDNPALWQSVGDLAALAEQLLIAVIADGNALMSESMEREIERLKSDLMEGVTPSPLERLTIQRIVATWLYTQYVDRATLAADAAGSKAASWGKRQEWAERRYQLAIKSLDLVRRLKPRVSPPQAEEIDHNSSKRDGENSDAAAANVDDREVAPQPNRNGHVTVAVTDQEYPSGEGKEDEDAGAKPVNRIRKVLAREKVLVT